MWLIDKIVSGVKGFGNDIKDMVNGQYDFTKGLFSNPNDAQDIDARTSQRQTKEYDK